MAILYFCVDGVVRIKGENDKYMFAVEFIQQQEKLSDLSFWSKWWNQPIVFEKDLTFAQFFQCLSPWLEFWGEITQKDLISYFAELKKPTLINNSDSDIDWLSVDYRTELRPVVNYTQEDNNTSNTTNTNNESITPEKTWHLYSYYELTGYILNQENAVLVEWLPLNQLANLPITLNGQQLTMIDEFFIKKYGTNEQQLVNPQGLGVNRIHEEDDHEAQFSYLEGPKTHTMREVIEGIFYRFDTSPQLRDEIDANFQEQYEDDLDDFSITVSSEESLREEMIELDEIYEEQRSIMSVKQEENEQYFKDLLRHAKQNSDSKIRIGRIEEAIPFEKRILQWIKKN